MVTVFLSSCERETTSINDAEYSDEAPLKLDDEVIEVLLPYGYDELPQEKQFEYINSLDEISQKKLIESANVFNYFESIGKSDILSSNSKYGEIYGKTTLSSYLTDEEVENYQLFMNNNLESRFGCDCDDYYQYRSCHTGYGYQNGVINLRYYEKWIKECHAWICPDRKQWRNEIWFPNPFPYCP